MRSSLGSAIRGGPLRRANGFTLLEVVVGLVLMASVLVSSMLAFTAHQRQLRYAEAKLEAVLVADALLESFTSSRDGIPPAASGPVNGRAGWYWRTQVVGVTAPADISLQVIRLQVLGPVREGSSRVLASLDVVRPLL